MKFEKKLETGTLIKRYKRFLADIKLDDGTELTAHCPNTGSMKMCADPGWKVGLLKSDNPNRKCPYTWEIVNNEQCWIAVNTHRTNHIAREGIEENLIPELSGYDRIRSEVKYGINSRIDLLLEDGEKPSCYVEVKNVTLIADDDCYIFPDAKTERGQKHLVELMEMVKQGHRAVMLFMIQRADATSFRPAHEIDPKYADLLKEARDNGVEILAYQTAITLNEIRVSKRIPLNF